MRGMLIGIRITAMIGWLLACIPAHFASQLIYRKSRLPRIFLGGICLIAGVNITRSGERAGDRTILLANHVSWLDIPILAASTGTAFVAHDGLADSVFLKWLCEMNDTVFIARTRRATVARQVDQVRSALERSPVLTLFPEGTTGNGRDLLPFKSALLSAIDPPPRDVAVQPVLVDFGDLAEEIAWAGDEPGLDNFFRILGRVAELPVTLHFLPPLTGHELDGRKTIASAVQSALTRAGAAR
ncbi:lysophospholipid acyltransferase family protein [Croceicoccus bisphenolivorans]|uniref:lysophospholipid acyltransferase family protein n=1 Tax=Croceicoccus bisphenolivorans TaxID=1783232 RepID=UPI00082D81DD|nr:lysophospholipid acyltransferase family protein [Croceicoccus bisphenolivorans]